jgi:hypothetical protein
MTYNGVDKNIRASSGVAIFIQKKWKTIRHNYSHINDRILIVRINIDLTVIGSCAPEEGKLKETEIFMTT